MTLFVTFVFDAAFAISLLGFFILHARLLQQNKVQPSLHNPVTPASIAVYILWPPVTHVVYCRCCSVHQQTAGSVGAALDVDAT